MFAGPFRLRLLPVVRPPVLRTLCESVLLSCSASVLLSTGLAKPVEMLCCFPARVHRLVRWPSRSKCCASVATRLPACATAVLCETSHRRQWHGGQRGASCVALRTQSQGRQRGGRQIICRSVCRVCSRTSRAGHARRYHAKARHASVARHDRHAGHDSDTTRNLSLLHTPPGEPQAPLTRGNADERPQPANAASQRGPDSTRLCRGIAPHCSNHAPQHADKSARPP